MNASIYSFNKHDHTTRTCSAHIYGLNSYRMGNQCENLGHPSKIQVSSIKKRTMKRVHSCILPFPFLSQHREDRHGDKTLVFDYLIQTTH
jgi:hypothetical protein